MKATWIQLKPLSMTSYKTSNYVINQPNIIIQLQLVCVEVKSEASQQRSVVKPQKFTGHNGGYPQIHSSTHKVYSMPTCVLNLLVSLTQLAIDNHKLQCS